VWLRRGVRSEWRTEGVGGRYGVRKEVGEGVMARWGGEGG